MTRDDVQRWLDRYIDAWKTYDRGQIAALFSADAEYRYHPWNEPVRGREAIVDDWLAPDGDAARRDSEGTYNASYEPWAIDGDRAVAVGTSDYFTDPTRTIRERRYHNTYLLEFDAEGRCRSFTENYQLER
ncbi:MAG: nuclear transport factor 2 family protein [Chloroflexota bacterium]